MCVWLRSAELRGYGNCTASAHNCNRSNRRVVETGRTPRFNGFIIAVLAMQLDELQFDNSSLHALPVETVSDDPRRVEPQRQVKGACWSPIKPEPLKSPALVAASLPCLALLDLQADQVCLFVRKANVHAHTYVKEGPDPFITYRCGELRNPGRCRALLTRCTAPALLNTSVGIVFCRDLRQQHTAMLAINLVTSAGNLEMVQQYTLERYCQP